MAEIGEDTTEITLSQEERRRRRFLEGVEIATLPAIGFGAAYFYALGRATQVGMPESLINVSLSDVLRAVVAILSPLALVYYVAVTITARFAGRLWSQWRAFISPILTFIIFVLFLVASQANLKTWLYALAVVGVLFVFSCVDVWQRARRGTGGWWSRLRLAATSYPQPQEAVLTRVIQRMGLTWYYYLLAIAVAMGLAYASGYGGAVNQRIFLELKGTNYLLVAHDGSQEVFDQVQSHRWTPNFILVPDSRTLSLRLTNVGPVQTDAGCKSVTC